MCGICGLIAFDPEIDQEAAVRAMTAAMRPRGPDGEGYLCEGPVALGMRRLAIIDPAGGHQPVFNEDGTVAVVFNGEICNFQALQRELEARGHVFRTRSDTEVIVHAYEAWGPECVHRLRGMFAFAIYDQRPTTNDQSVRPSSFVGGRLFLARDRLGIKPLYYCQHDGIFLFASEVRALLASGLVPRRLSREGLYSYLAFGSVQEPLTLIQGVYALPPGHGGELRIAPACAGRDFGLRISGLSFRNPKSEIRNEVTRYWNFPGPGGPSEVADPAVLRELLTEAMGLWLVSDVPLGIFLSGGIDSSAVLRQLRTGYTRRLSCSHRASCSVECGM